MLSEILKEFFTSEIALWVGLFTICGTVFTFYRYVDEKRKTNKLEFIKQLEYYEKELFSSSIEFSKSQRKYRDCVLYVKHHLTILDRLAYLKEKKLVNDDFMNYFEVWFNEGRTEYDWLEKIENDDNNSTYENTYLHFNNIKNKIEYSSKSIALGTFLKYYKDLKSKKPDINLNDM